MKQTLPHEKQIEEYEATILQLKEQTASNGMWSKSEILQLEEKLEALKKRVYSNLNPWERVTICRHPARPHTIDYLSSMFTDFTELFGDRTFGDDHAIMGGIAKIGKQKCVVIGQEKGSDTEERIYRNFGMPHPEGFRKALRLAKLAEKFSLPIVTLVDTAGAYPGLSAEERGQGWAIARNLSEFSMIKTPIIVVIIGEGCSGGALGIAVGDAVGMLEHSYYSVISPEGCASILWKDATRNQEAASILKFNTEHLLENGVIDEMIPEPLGGAHHMPQVAYNNVQNFILNSLSELQKLSPKKLVEHRYAKFRKIGSFNS